MYIHNVLSCILVKITNLVYQVQIPRFTGTASHLQVLKSSGAPFSVKPSCVCWWFQWIHTRHGKVAETQQCPTCDLQILEFVMANHTPKANNLSRSDLTCIIFWGMAQNDSHPKMAGSVCPILPLPDILFHSGQKCLNSP